MHAVYPRNLETFARCFTAEWHLARVGIDYHVVRRHAARVEVQGLFYSVPHALIREQVDTRATQRTIEVFHRGKRVAAHARRYGGPRHGAHTEHMSSAHRRYAAQRATVFHPDDPLFARFRHSIETEQGTVAKRIAARAQSTLPAWLLDQLAATERESGIVPLESNALGLRYGLLRPGPDYVLHRPEQDAAQTEMLDPPSVLERRLRHRIGEMVARQAVEDEGAIQAPRGEGLYHRYNAILKRRTGNKKRAELSLAELEAAVSWLERNRLSDHAETLEGDPRYGWTVRQRREWTPPVGRANGRPRTGSARLRTIASQPAEPDIIP